MDILNNFYAMESVSAPGESPITVNRRSDTLTVQIEGDFSGASVQLMGCSDLQNEEFHVITGFDTSFGIIDNMETTGIYTFPIEGMGKFKFNVSAIASGSLSVFCRMTTGG